MSVNSTNKKISSDSYLTAATGAVVSGGVVAGANHIKLKNLADKTVSAFNSTPFECDQFVKKNNGFLSRAIESKRGFFGKINKAIKNLSNPDEIAESVKKSSSDLIDGYRNKAARKIGNTMEGNALKKGISELSNKYLSKDILKSFKDATRMQNILKVSGAVLFGAVAACAIKEVVSRKINANPSKVQADELNKKLPENKQETKSTIEANSTEAKDEVLEDKEKEDEQELSMREIEKGSIQSRTTSQVNTDKGGNARTPRTTVQVNGGKHKK